ncbi:MAG: OmpA family protein [Balneolaceae bacterium]
MSEKKTHYKKNSLFPEQPFEEEDDDSWQISYLDIITIVLGFLIILLSFSRLKENEKLSVSDLFDSSVVETEFITTPVDDIRLELEELLRDDIDKGNVVITRDLNDLRIRFKSDDFYDSGSASLKPGGLKQLSRVLLAIKQNKYTDFNIDVEGHTDSNPISTAKFPSNWELSTARASNVVRYFNSLGIPATRLKASGYADSRPQIILDSLGNPLPVSNEMNRRIVLRLYYTLEKDIASTIPEEVNPEPIAKPIEEPVVIAEPVVEPTPEVEIKDQPKIEVEPPVKEKEDKVVSPIIPVGCNYTVQVGGFESFYNSLQIAEQTAEKTGIDFDIYYVDNIFLIRTKTTQSLSPAQSALKNISTAMPNLPATGIILKCSDKGSKTPKPLEYQIQLGYFQTRQNAEIFSEQLQSEHQITTVIRQFSPNAYAVLTTTSKSLKTTLSNVRSYSNVEISNNIFVRYVQDSFTEFKFTVQLQIGSYNNRVNALQSSDKINNLLGLTSSVVEARSGVYHVTTPKLSSWPVPLEHFNKILNSNLDLTPVIYFIEYK